MHIHFRKFSTERKIFLGPHAQYGFFFRKNRTAHALRGKFFRSVENILKCICILIWKADKKERLENIKSHQETFVKAFQMAKILPLEDIYLPSEYPFEGLERTKRLFMLSIRPWPALHVNRIARLFSTEKSLNCFSYHSCMYTGKIEKNIDRDFTQKETNLNHVDFQVLCPWQDIAD